MMQADFSMHLCTLTPWVTAKEARGEAPLSSTVSAWLYLPWHSSIPYPVWDSSQHQMLQGRYKCTMWTDVEQLVPLCQALSWVLRPREALNLTDCMWLVLLPRIFSLIRTTLNTLKGYRIFFISESCWKMAINDGSRQWFLQPTCLLQGKKYSHFFIL